MHNRSTGCPVWAEQDTWDWQRNTSAMLQTQTVAEAEEDALGCLGYTFGLQWPLAIKCKVLSCCWKIHFTPNRTVMFPTLSLSLVRETARTTHQKSGLRSVSPGKHYTVLQMGEPNQQTTGFPVLHTARMCCFFVQFLVLLTSVSFCLQSPTPPVQQNTELRAQFMLFNESGWCWTAGQQKINHKVHAAKFLGTPGVLQGTISHVWKTFTGVWISFFSSKINHSDTQVLHKHDTAVDNTMHKSYKCKHSSYIFSFDQMWHSLSTCSLEINTMRTQIPPTVLSHNRSHCHQAYLNIECTQLLCRR